MVVEKRTSHHHSHRKKFSLSVKSVYSLWPCQAPAILISTSSFRAIIIHGSTTRTLCPARVSPKFLIELPFFLCFFYDKIQYNRQPLQPLKITSLNVAPKRYKHNFNNPRNLPCLSLICVLQNNSNIIYIANKLERRIRPISGRDNTLCTPCCRGDKVNTIS